MPRTVSKTKPSASGSAFSGPLAARGIIRQAHVSEKATDLERQGTYVFEVNGVATKVDIARTVERRFKVTVRGVRIINTRPKRRRIGRTMGQTPGFKKAFVTLAKGQTIGSR